MLKHTEKTLKYMADTICMMRKLMTQKSFTKIIINDTNLIQF